MGRFLEMEESLIVNIRRGAKLIGKTAKKVFFVTKLIRKTTRKVLSTTLLISRPVG